MARPEPITLACPGGGQIAAGFPLDPSSAADSNRGGAYPVVAGARFDLHLAEARALGIAVESPGDRLLVVIDGVLDVDLEIAWDDEPPRMSAFGVIVLPAGQRAGFAAADGRARVLEITTPPIRGGPPFVWTPQLKDFRVGGHVDGQPLLIDHGGLGPALALVDCSGWLEDVGVADAERYAFVLDGALERVVRGETLIARPGALVDLGGDPASRWRAPDRVRFISIILYRQEEGPT